MPQVDQLRCEDDARRALIRESETLHGIDYLEVAVEPAADNQRLLHVFFIPKNTVAGSAKLTAMIDAISADFRKLVHISGGVRIRDVEVLEAVALADTLRLRVNHSGDFSAYQLSIEYTRQPADDPQVPKLDAVFASLEFNFKAGCPSQFDCRIRRECEPEIVAEPVIDYQAKDYSSFREALLDRIASTMPEWTERNAADLGMALVEVLSYAGDHLSYYQDAVATEAFLETARQRISVRRHARLIDYAMHDGVSARVFVQFMVDNAGVLPAGTPLLTRLTAPLPSGSFAPVVIPDKDSQAAKTVAMAVFETCAPTALHPGLVRIQIHTWGMQECCHPKGTTQADLVGDLTAQLNPGGYLLFEEVLGSESGEPQDADRSRRQIVRLTHVEAAFDDALNQPLTRVTWSPEDALRFPLCVSLRIGESALIADVSVARGNLALADHGQTVRESHTIPDTEDPGPRPYRLRVSSAPLSFRISESSPSVSALASADPRRAVPQAWVELRTKENVLIPDWRAQRDLLSSEAEDRSFVVETDNTGQAGLRFGDDTMGMAPPAGSALSVTYRFGVGTAGNIPMESIHHVVAPPILPVDWPAITQARNPMAAFGGLEPELIEEVKLTAPAALREGLFRAVTEEDYAAVASKCPGVSKAVATFRWTGTWHTVFLTVDPVGSNELDADLTRQVRNWVLGFAQAGYDLEIEPPVFVPVEIEADICAKPGYFPSDVELAIRETLSNRVLSRGRRGVFHPDQFTFGQPLYLSQIYAAIADIPGVLSATVRVFKRLGRVSNQEFENGVIRAGRTEIIRLDNNPSAAENGVITLNVRGSL